MNYLYNGIELPDIYGVYTKELQKTHPFAYIGQGMGYFLYLTTAPFKVDQNGPLQSAQAGAVSGTGLILYNASPWSTEWTKLSEGEVDGDYTYWNPFWANYEVKTLGGATYLEPSDPVPVSPVQLNPADVVQGYFVGIAVKRMR